MDAWKKAAEGNFVQQKTLNCNWANNNHRKTNNACFAVDKTQIAFSWGAFLETDLLAIWLITAFKYKNFLINDRLRQNISCCHTCRTSQEHNLSLKSTLHLVEIVMNFNTKPASCDEAVCGTKKC